jgi:hypothetical protein
MMRSMSLGMDKLAREMIKKYTKARSEAANLNKNWKGRSAHILVDGVLIMKQQEEVCEEEDQ